MNTKSLILVCVAIFGLMFCFSLVGQYNTQSKLQNLYEMKLVDNQSQFDNMFKKLANIVEVSDMQKQALVDIIVGNSKARVGSGDNMTMWVQEACPNVDTSIYKTILNLVVSSRDAWTMRQRELVDTAREYNANLSTVWGRLFLSGVCGFEKIKPNIVTSSKTERAFATGKDDDYSLKPSK